MSHLDTALPSRWPELVLNPSGDRGHYVVKNPRRGVFYRLGEKEFFLLSHLDGTPTWEFLSQAFSERFHQPLTQEEFHQFLGLAQAAELLQPVGEMESSSNGQPSKSGNLNDGVGKQSILYWRKSLFDPNRFFSWLAPKLWFFWTRTFLAISACCILGAAFLAWVNRKEVTSTFVLALRWETAVLAGLTLLMVTILHEFAHGLTCKHHGGEVHEVGFLLMFFLPCFYCNVSDAWLFQDKAKRLWVSLAGCYFELFLWALAVFTWRLTVPDCLLNYLAFVVMSISGIRTLFNFIPFIKLDGYYLLSDSLGIPNLRLRALNYLTGHLRWFCWGGPRPPRERKGKFLLIFGMSSWLFSLTFLVLMLLGLGRYLGGRWGWLGVGGAMALGLMTVPGFFQGFTKGEVSNMVFHRRKRALLWVLILGALVGLLLIPMEDWASGPVQVRPGVRAEIRAPVAGFLQEVSCEEGDCLSLGAVLGRLEIPDLPSRMVQKQAEVREAQAKLRLLEIGPRPEEVAEQREKVDRAKNWRDLGQQDLTRMRQTLQEELNRLDKQISVCQVELEAAQDAFQRAKQLWNMRAIAQEQFKELESNYRVCQARLSQAQAEKQVRQSRGTLETEAELARREKELADARGTLKVLLAGTRPEEILAQQACLARVQEEAYYLEKVQAKVMIHSPVPGLLVTPRFKEKVGQFFKEGDLIGVVEGILEAEITLGEQEVTRIQTGMAVDLRIRALPFQTLTTKVHRIAPRTLVREGPPIGNPNEVQGQVIVYCQLESSNPELRPGMTGHARIYTGRRSIGEIMLDRMQRFLRTEFWW